MRDGFDMSNNDRRETNAQWNTVALDTVLFNAGRNQ